MNQIRNDEICILLVDEDKAAIRELTNILQPLGFNCVPATSAVDAIEFVHQGMPSLIISNIDLDDVTAEEFVRVVKDLRPSSDIPVIFVCNEYRFELVEECRLAGGECLLSRPVNADVLTDAIQNSLWMPHLVDLHIESTKKTHVDTIQHAHEPKSSRKLRSPSLQQEKHRRRRDSLRTHHS